MIVQRAHHDTVVDQRVSQWPAAVRAHGVECAQRIVTQSKDRDLRTVDTECPSLARRDVGDIADCYLCLLYTSDAADE